MSITLYKIRPWLRLAERKFLGFGLVFVIFVLFHLSISRTQKNPPSLSYLEGISSWDSCTPEAYGSGEWSYRPRSNTTAMTGSQDALLFSGFEGCASSREYLWHLAADKEDQYDRFPTAQSWEWIPGQGCEHMGRLTSEALVKHLVEDGGWYLVGDSVTENHFFSISCLLYPHVIATPDYASSSSFDRGWPQNLYLSPSSSLISSLSFPEGFDISKIPLVTFRRVDLLFSKDELIDIYRNATLFSTEATWTLPLDEYLKEFTAQFPEAHYTTMVVNTGGHWTTTLFSDIRPSGIESVLNLFKKATEQWSKRIQEKLYVVNKNSINRFRGHSHSIRKRVIVRAYLPGHEDCHKFREPWKEVQPLVWNWYNWGNIQDFNEVFKKTVQSEGQYPDIFFLPIDRPARLRPDSHTTGDCLHIMAGAGVLEGWTHYMWHFLSRH